MTKLQRELTILELKELNERYFLLKLYDSKPLPPIIPGQFVEVAIPNCEGAFLRRPFSIHDVCNDSNCFSLLIKKIGKRTNYLSSCLESSKLDTIFPLGNGFSIAKHTSPLLVGGGIGSAPLLYLAKWFANMGHRPTVLLGGKTKEDIVRVGEFEKFAKMGIGTDDGSLGEKGLITEHPILQTTEPDKIYACGPMGMMKALADYAHGRRIELEVSLERNMACAIGACLCCVVPIENGNSRVCCDGPVFDSRNLDWGKI